MKLGYKIYRVLRSILVSVILTMAGIYIILYLVLSVPSVQSKVKSIGEAELSKLVGAELSIGELQFSPFNQVVLYDVFIPDAKGDTVFVADKIGAGISMYNLLVNRRIVFTYAELIGLDARLKKERTDGPLNIQFIIDAFSNKDNKKTSKKFDLKIHNIVIRKSSFSYDVESAENLSQDRFDINHVKIENFRSDIALPRLKNNDFLIELKRLSLKEKSGFYLKNLSVEALVSDTCLKMSKLKVELNNSLIAPEEVQMNINGLASIGKCWKNSPIKVSFANNYVTPADFVAFVPILEKFDIPINFTFIANGTLNNLEIPVFMADASNGMFDLEFSGDIKNMFDINSMKMSIPHFDINASAAEIAKVTSSMTGMSDKIERIISNCGDMRIAGYVIGAGRKLNFDGSVYTDKGTLALDGTFSSLADGMIRSYSGNVSTEEFDIGGLLSMENVLGSMACDIKLKARDRYGNMDGRVDGLIKYADIKGYRYQNIDAMVSLDKKTIEGYVGITDENGMVKINGMALADGPNSAADLIVSVNGLDLNALNLIDKFPGHKMSFDLDMFLTGNDLNNLTGNVQFKDFAYVDSLDDGIHLKEFIVEADNVSSPKNVHVKSDIVNGGISGQYDVYELTKTVKEMLAKPFPALFAEEENVEGMNMERKKSISNNFGIENVNNLYFGFNVDNVEEITEFFNLPVEPLSTVTLEGFITESNESFYVMVDAPYLRQKNKLIEGSRIQVSLDRDDHNLLVEAGSIIPLKKGKLNLQVNANGIGDRLDTDVSWTVDNKESFSGSVNVSTLLKRDSINELTASVDINPTKLIFNDTAWQVHPSKVNIAKHDIKVRDFLVTCEDQFIKINGNATENPEDDVIVELNDINLDYVFETLAINNVTFGGRATGKFLASDLFSGIPRFATPGLDVKGLSYNNALFGDALIHSAWLNEEKCVTIKADVVQRNGCQSDIDGKIFIAKDSLYFDFKPERINVAFLKPFMSAFSSDIQGEASGHAVLYGTFKNINLWGDVHVDSLRMKLDYTNVYYTVIDDSVQMRPGHIMLNNVVMRDPYGNTALLTGEVMHDYFHDAVFKFSVTDANGFLCYDVPQELSPDWYGTIYGNGSAFVDGEPGLVNVEVNMATAANSRFTFVLSDSKVATEYDFITFVDRNKNGAALNDSLDNRPEKVKDFVKNQNQTNDVSPSLFDINLLVEATPQAQITLVMDPDGGDRIKATGSGNLRIGYNSTDEEMTMFGAYTLEKGDYNFTLQDIIIKDFTIREGSRISFNGDPLSAVLDIEAIYSLYANLAELDESFTTDGDLNRTNVPVNALLRLQGDISEPDISFDLEFPTLTSDVYRKVMSIISTEDMMNRQIIYLLALNSFYTPDYMADSSRSNELVSVASSTISSQLTNLLGQMSENWSVSPNFRSENGDFSDIEVELALSSQLLNNRLLFNGNFGYRDNALNTRNSNFIGDFDIEYLLTKNGNIRLKAYNHYNDQNYYVRSALTTQGVGVVFKRDFDNIYDLLGIRKKKQLTQDGENRLSTDSIM